MLFAQNLNGSYWGEVTNQYYVNGALYTFEASYNFKDGKYLLKIDVGSGKNFNAFNISNKYLKKVAGLYEYSETGSYSVCKKNGFSYISFYDSTPFQAKKSLGVLQYKNNFMFVDGRNVWFQCFSNLFDIGGLQDVKSIKTSSFLSEKDIQYTGENFKNIQTNLLPWVEGVNGDGIGEWIEVTFKVWDAGNGNICFLISNGYVDFSRTDLYYANNRVKKMQIVCEKYKIDFDAELLDTHQFQLIEIPIVNVQNEEIVTFRFIIKEVFKGDKYEDTCVNLILPFQQKK